MVSSTHWLASASGMAVLETGGNAFDAAVAAGFVLQVVEPHLNGPGGEVPIVLYDTASDDVCVVNGQGVCPASATLEAFEELGLPLVPGTGLLAACVPGAFDAWMITLRDFGTVRLREAMGYAIAYARDGYPVVDRMSRTVESVEELFRQEWKHSAALYLDGGVPRAGSLFRNRELAACYERIVDEAETATGDRDDQIDEARRIFYEGWVAEAIGEFCARAVVMDVSGRRHGGFLRAADMAAWEATIEEPLWVDYGRYRIFKTGPWGQGPVFLQQLMLLRDFDLVSMGHNSAAYIHCVVECAKLAFADREAWYGDPSFGGAPIAALLDPQYADERRALVSEVASLELRPGRPEGRTPRLPTARGTARVEAYSGSGYGAGEPTVGGDTCQVDVVDRHGNMVAATPSGGWLQSSPAIPGLGFCLGTRAQMFWLEAGHPNSLQPRKRPRSTLSPSLVFRDGEPYMAFGTPGGDTQDQWSLNFFLSHAHFGLNLQEAIDAPMFHTDHFPNSFYPRSASPGRVEVESRIDASVIDALCARGHDIAVADAWSLGRLSAVAKEGAMLKAAANPRGMQGYAVGR